MDSRELVIYGLLDDSKVSADDRRNKTIVVFRDVDGQNIVVDGRHSAARAAKKREMVNVVFVDSKFKLGKQTVFERIAGMLFRRKEG